MSAGGGPGLSEVPGWTVSVLLILLLGASLIFEFLLHTLQRYWERRKKRSLLVFLGHFKDELLLVGFISLFLSVFQDQLSGICYDFDEGGASYRSRRRLLMPRLANGWYHMATVVIRRSLSASAAAPSGNSSASNPPSDYGSSACGPNQQPLWTANLQHETHLFLFAVALTHIMYSTFTLLLGKYLVGLWRQWEDRCWIDPLGDKASLLQGVHTGCLGFLRKRIGLMPNGFGRFFSALILHFEGVTYPMYRDMRALFIIDLPIGPQKSSVDEDLQGFDFHAILVDTLETNLADISKAEWELWVIAVTLIAIPSQYDIPLVLLLVGVGILSILGAKLMICTYTLTEKVAVRASLASMEKSQRSAPFDRTSRSQAEATLSTIIEAAGAIARERKRVILREELLGIKLARALEARRLKRLESFQFSISRSTVQLAIDSRILFPSSTLVPGDRGPSSSSVALISDPLAAADRGPLTSTGDMEGPSTESTSSLRAAESSGDDILDISVTSGGLPRQQSELNSLSHAVGQKEHHYVPLNPVTTSQQPLDFSEISARNDGQSTKSVKDLPTSFEISAVQDMRPDSEGSPTTPEGMPINRAVTSLWGRANRTRMWLGKGSRSPSQDWRSTWWGVAIVWLFGDSANAAMLTRAVKRFREENPPLAYEDATDLFWLKSPRLVIILIQMVFFDNALNIAIGGFAIFESSVQGFSNITPFAISSLLMAIVVLCLAAIVLVYSIFCIIPLLALVMPLSSKCSDDILKRAMKGCKVELLLNRPEVLPMSVRSSLKAATLMNPPIDAPLDVITEVAIEGDESEQHNNV